MDYVRIRERLMRPEHTGAPADLTDDPRRTFVRTVPCAECQGSGTVTVVWDGYEEWGCGSCEVSGNAKDAPVDAEPGPDHIEAIADCPAFRDAETAARAVAAALAPWGHRPADRIAWRVGATRDPRVGAAYHRVLPTAVHEALDAAAPTWKPDVDIKERDLGLGHSGDGEPAVAVLMRWHANNHARLAAAAGLGLHYPADGLPAGVAGRPVTDVPNPFTPLLDVWRTGFAPEQIDEAGIRLYAPRRDAVAP